MGQSYKYSDFDLKIWWNKNNFVTLHRQKVQEVDIPTFHDP